MKISLIMPVYNEEKIIKNTLEELSSFIKKEKKDWEIFIVNDGSTDNTLKILKDSKYKFFKIISYKKNKGKGFAVRTGVKKATGDYICFLDSDLSYSFDNAKKLLITLKNYDIVIGSRALVSDKKDLDVLRKILSKGFRITSFIILDCKIKDKQCGLKAFKKQVAKDLFSKQTINGWSFDTEILYLAQKRNYSIKEVPAFLSETHSYKGSKVNLLKDPIKMFFNLWKIKLNNFLGKYD